MNIADSNLIAAHLQNRGMTLTDAREEAGIIILNTCRPLRAERKALSLIGSSDRSNAPDQALASGGPVQPREWEKQKLHQYVKIHRGLRTGGISAFSAG